MRSLLTILVFLTLAAPAAAADQPQVDGYYFGDGNPVIDVFVPFGQGGTVELRQCTDAASPCTAGRERLLRALRGG